MEPDKTQEKKTEKPNPDNDDNDIDLRKIYMTKREKRTRVGKEYQAVIPELRTNKNFPKNNSNQSSTKSTIEQLTNEHKARVIYEREPDNTKPVKKVKHSEKDK